VDRLKEEIVTEIILPEMQADRFVFEKVANRRADAIAKISFAGSMRLDEGRVGDVRFAFGAVGPTIIRSLAIEQKLKGEAFPLDPKIIDEVAADFDQIINPIDDHRSTAAYRKTVALRLLRHFLETM